MSKPLMVAAILVLAALDKPALSQDTVAPKRTISQFLAPAADEIAAHLADFKPEPNLHVTQSYTPLFSPGPDGKLKAENRRDCLNVEGTCLVGGLLYNYPNTIQNRSDVVYKFGKGNGPNTYNTTNALDPCRTLAADAIDSPPKKPGEKPHKAVYPIGTVIFIPEMKNKVCPQSGKPVDGAFIVGDIGKAITGEGRFDIFAGECSQYIHRTNSCNDQAIGSFFVPDDTPFYVIPRDNPLAKRLREQADAFVKRDWQ
jgi:hypothetical protein